ncbi:hypothetical protein DEO72_LG11g2053 [Vigna unguiculata]|uniref:Uncharacterized protein n=1 Tax=Vigna unguiculata TaxID=3917 RepID=A0A4D6NS02_VIGUN|nr:hypothetical protein DEO72_LG11g2053 [Vigna unguiculata]
MVLCDGYGTRDAFLASFSGGHSGCVLLRRLVVAGDGGGKRRRCCSCVVCARKLHGCCCRWFCSGGVAEARWFPSLLAEAWWSCGGSFDGCGDCGNGGRREGDECVVEMAAAAAAMVVEGEKKIRVRVLGDEDDDVAESEWSVW